MTEVLAALAEVLPTKISTPDLGEDGGGKRRGLTGVRGEVRKTYTQPAISPDLNITRLKESPVHEVRPLVLVVDDDPGVLDMLTSLLRQIGFQVISSGSAVEAYGVLESCRDIEVLVSDFEMPQMNGEQLAAAAKKLRPSMPVFILSGKLPPHRSAAPWDGWFMKGASINALVQKLERVPQSVEGAA